MIIRDITVYSRKQDQFVLRANEGVKTNNEVRNIDNWTEVTIVATAAITENGGPAANDTFTIDYIENNRNLSEPNMRFVSESGGSYTFANRP